MTEIEKLKLLLLTADIPFEEDHIWGGDQIIYPDKQNRVCDAVCHSFSYGHKEGLLEMMGLTKNKNDIEGCLTAEDVFYRIKKHYDANYIDKE